MPDPVVSRPAARPGAVFYLHGFTSSAGSAKAGYFSEEWRRKGAIPFFHYGYNEERLLDFGFYEDTARYDGFDASVLQPTLIFQGIRDTSVDYRTVERFARTRPNVTLSLLDDDHQLIASLPGIWNDVEAFLALIE
jgi:pimeloyl-ACP methyl ester carboxylesterase